MSIFTGALVTIVFSSVYYLRSRRDVFELLTCLYDRIKIYISKSKEISNGLVELEKDLWNLKISAVEIFNELGHMLKASKKEREIYKNYSNIIKEIRRSDVFTENFDKILPEIEQVEKLYYSKKYFNTIQELRKSYYGKI